MNSQLLLPLGLSLRLALWTVLGITIVATPLAYHFTLKPKKWHMLPEFFINLPLVFPPVILGFYLLLLFSPQHGPGRLFFTMTSRSLAFSFAGILLASFIYSFPHMYRQARGIFGGVDSRYLELARTLGKTEIRIFFQVVLPQTALALLSSVLFCFSHILGAFGVIVMVGGSIPGKTKVASIALYELVESFEYQSALQFSLVLAGLSLGIMLLREILTKIASGSLRCIENRREQTE